MVFVIKVVLSTMLVIATFWGTIFVTLFFIPTDLGLLLGFLLGLVTAGFILFYFYPIWFKDYIEEYWEKQKVVEK